MCVFVCKYLCLTVLVANSFDSTCRLRFAGILTFLSVFVGCQTEKKTATNNKQTVENQLLL